MPTSSKKSTQDSSYFLTEFYCKLSIKNVEILPQNILQISIRESIFDLVPTLELSILDNGVFVESYPLEDCDSIKIQLGQSNLKTPVINMEFELQDFNISNVDGDNIHIVQINLTAIVKNKNMFLPLQTRSFSSKSSLDVLKSIASESGFTPIVKTSTSDVMTWRQIQQNNYQMVYETMKRAYKPDDAILTGITRNKDFIITSLMTELKNKSAKKTLYDPLQAISLSNEKSKDKKEIIYFNNFSMSNVSGFVNKSIGYGLGYSVYNFDEVENKTIYSTFHPLTKYSFKNKDNTIKIVKNNRLYFLNNKTMHRNYVDAINQNEFYTKDFFKNCCLLYVNPNENINLFDKLDITFPSFENKNGVNQPQSGQWIVGTILHEASKEGYYRMTLGLFRNGINQSSEMKDSEFKVAK